MDTETIVLSGDGTTDDTAAIQAFADGRVIGYADGRPVQVVGDGRQILAPGTYLVSKTILV